MIIFLGILDIIIAISAALFTYGIYSQWLMIVLSVYLMVKGAIFIRSVASIIDIAAGAILILGLFVTLPNTLFWVIAAYLLQKGILSFL